MEDRAEACQTHELVEAYGMVITNQGGGEEQVKEVQEQAKF